MRLKKHLTEMTKIKLSTSLNISQAIDKLNLPIGEYKFEAEGFKTSMVDFTFKAKILVREWGWLIQKNKKGYRADGFKISPTSSTRPNTNSIISVEIIRVG